MPRIARAPATDGRKKSGGCCEVSNGTMSCNMQRIDPGEEGESHGHKESVCVVGEKQEKWTGELPDINKYHDMEEVEKSRKQVQGG